MRKIFFLFVLVFCLLGIQINSSVLPMKYVRVLILNMAKDFKIAVKGNYVLADLTTSKEITGGKVLRETKVYATDRGIMVNNQEYFTQRLKIQTQKDGTLYVNGRKLRGDLIIIKDPSKNFLVINQLEIESYIKGVMFHEVSHFWPIESLKAQAIAARTYALFQMRLNQKRDYDVTNDIYSQVYGGQASERYRTNIAVDKTKGMIMTFKGQVLPAYFHATCAGHTEDAGELWDINLLPLKGVVCPYCNYSPHAHWKRNFRLKNIQDKLNEKKYSLGLIKDIAVLDRNKSDRIKMLQITTRDGKVAKISGKDFREIIGPNIIRSNNYKIIMQGYFMDLVGQGWGHGVGLCQWGACEMSYRGLKYNEILKFYYPGIEIVSDETARL